MAAPRRRRGREPIAVLMPNLGANASPTAVSRAVDQLSAAVVQIGATPRYVEIDLAAGVNLVAHALGRTPIGMWAVFQTAAVDLTYDWTQPGNPHPDRVAAIVSGGVARARLFFF